MINQNDFVCIKHRLEAVPDLFLESALPLQSAAFEQLQAICLFRCHFPLCVGFMRCGLFQVIRTIYM